MMKKINVELAERSYPIYIGSGLLSDQDLLDRHLTSSQVLIVTNEVIAQLYLSKLEQSMADVDYDVMVLPEFALLMGAGGSFGKHTGPGMHI